ncbi:hypothetical protein GEOBRER4_n1900 [Citrifermentans bremense]|uniref:Uncharacterized protein n=1 Tax=Citrifermentans bremense TaxID=60035 RepID=A0A6S6LYC9_9BACT|nr:hypothetical protein [Citrifermentans bremense]BCG47077.1 hypothetical protein GEOBRER4_n1900 [Citrifermentans bremense]
MHSDLTQRALQLLKGRFKEIGHTPSLEQLAALHEIQHTLSLMAKGKLEQKMYLSSLHPGIGKSTAVITAIQAYVQCHEMYGEQGVIMCFDRHEEIVRMVKDMNLPRHLFAVKVANHSSNRELNEMGLGSTRINEALVLLTTKQQITRLGQRGQRYSDMSRLFYLGKPRTIRIVDESMTSGIGLKLVVRKFAKLPDELSDSHPTLASSIEELVQELVRFKNGATFYVPDFGEKAKANLSSFKWSSAEVKDVADTFLRILGREVTVKATKYGNVAIDCDDILPDDFLPCLVTDASGDVRGTYAFQAKYRKNLVRLKGADKDYSNLTVNVWRQASGKIAYQTNGNKLYVAEIVKAINSRPDEQFLVLRFLSNPELEADIIEKVIQPERVKFTHYGLHTATNEYRDIPNMIITGILSYRSEDYEALARAAAGLRTGDGVLPPEVINDLRHGEHAHHLLQAGCRTTPRKSEGAGCPEARLWLIAPKGILPDNEIARIFPGCAVQRWVTMPRSLKGPLQVALDYLMDKFSNGINEVPGSEVRTFIGVAKQNFKRDIIQNVDFSDTLQNRNISIEKRSNGAYIFRDTSYLRELVESLTKGNQTPIGISL